MRCSFATPSSMRPHTARCSSPTVCVCTVPSARCWSHRVAGAQPEIVAYHLGAAGRAIEAVPLWKQAAHTARQNARFREAAGHEREVLALVERLPEEEREHTELKSRSRLVMCLTAVDQSAPEALEESRRVEELARRLNDREILLRNYMVLVPWWQASAEYSTINRILAEARSEAEALGDEWTLQLITTYEATTRIWQGMLHQGLAADPGLVRDERPAARRQLE